MTEAAVHIVPRAQILERLIVIRTMWGSIKIEVSDRQVTFRVRFLKVRVRFENMLVQIERRVVWQLASNRFVHWAGAV